MPVTAPEILLRKHSPSESSVHPRILIFSASLVMKGIIGVLFFGSVDLINSATNSLALLAGGQVHLPYLPAINAFLWFGGVLSATLGVPFPLSLKLVPILFDSLLAVLIYDLVRRSEPPLALRAGLLYALSPIALLITSFHGQWDAIALFFLLLAFGVLQGSRLDPRKELLFGVLFGVSILIKPIGIPFLLLFPSGKRWKRIMDRPAIVGLAVVLGIAFVIFASCGYSIVDTLILIFCYSAKGAQEVGLPFSPFLSHFHIQNYRLYWILPAMAGIGWLHHRRKLTAIDAVLLFYLYCTATTGISPQYLLWPLPFLIVTKRLRLAALYTAVATAFLLIFYSNPWASYFAFENMGVFAPLRAFSWLLPPAALEKCELLTVVHALGNLVLPACAMVIGAYVVRTSQRQMAEEHNRVDELWHWSAVRWYVAPSFLLCATMLVSKLTVNTSQLYFRLAQIWNTLPGAYGLRILWRDPKIVVVQDSAGYALPNIVVLLALYAAIWCVLCIASAVARMQTPRYTVISEGMTETAADA